MVNSPQNFKTEIYTRGLANYFSIPRLVFLGDIIVVPLPRKKFTSGLNSVYDQTFDPDTVIDICYFKIASLKKEGNIMESGFISFDFTNLHQASHNVNSRIPSYIEEFFGIPLKLPCMLTNISQRFRSVTWIQKIYRRNHFFNSTLFASFSRRSKDICYYPH